MSLRCDNCRDEKRQCLACSNRRYQTEEYKQAKRERDKKRYQTEEYRASERIRQQAEDYKKVKREGDKRRHQTEEYKELRREYDKRQRAKNQQQIKARHAVSYATQKGVIPPANSLLCQDCEQPAAEYHHESYERDKWLDVIPLCRQCHASRHPKVPPSSTQDLTGRFDHIQGAK